MRNVAPADLEARPERGPADRNPAVFDARYRERGACCGRPHPGRSVNGRCAGFSALGSSSDDPGRAADELPAAPGHAGSEVPQGSATADAPVRRRDAPAEPTAASSAAAADPATARTFARSPSTVRPRTPTPPTPDSAWENATAAGEPADRREPTSARPSAAEAERAAAGLSPGGERQPESDRATPMRTPEQARGRRVAGLSIKGLCRTGRRPSPAPPPTTPRRPPPLRPPRPTARCAAPWHPGEKGAAGAGEASARPAGGRATDQAATPTPASAAWRRPPRRRPAAPALPRRPAAGACTFLPGARNPAARQPQTEPRSPS